MSKSILNDFLKDIGDGLGKVFDGNIFEGVGEVVGGTLKGVGRTVGATCEVVGDLLNAIFEDGQVSLDEIPNDEKYTYLLPSLVSMLAKMAKADGRVTKSETRFLSDLIDGIGCSGEGAEELKKFANAAIKDADRTIYDYAQLCFAASNCDDNIGMKVYIELWGMALLDGGASEAQLKILQNIPRCLGLEMGVYDQVLDCLKNEGAASPQGASLDEYYKILGCSPTASDAEVRRCYKKQVAQYHPDTISGKDLAPGFVEFANQQSAKINEAYAAIKAARSMQ